MSLQDITNAEIRLTILRLLADDPGYDLNESILKRALAEFGYEVSTDALRTQLAWLEEQGAISPRTVAGSLLVAKLTTRGEDIAAGRARVPGIARPRPQELD